MEEEEEEVSSTVHWLPSSYHVDLNAHYTYLHCYL